MVYGYKINLKGLTVLEAEICPKGYSNKWDTVSNCTHTKCTDMVDIPDSDHIVE